MDSQAGRIVVGYDGSPRAGLAVDWAAAVAQRRQLPLTVLHILDYMGMIPGPVGPPLWPNLAKKAALEVAEEGARRARKVVESTEVTAVTKIDRVAYSLVESSREAELIVVGTRGHGEAAGVLLGSVGFAVSAHALCPVAVVRGDSSRLPGPDRPVVVGVDGSPSSHAALAYARGVAVSTAAPLVIVTAYQSTASQPWAKAAVYTVENHGGPTFGTIAEEAAEKLAAAAVETVLEQSPPVNVSARALEGRTVSVLTAAAANAGLLVVGSRGHGGFVGLLLGSVSHGAIHLAPGPVVVVRAFPEPPGVS